MPIFNPPCPGEIIAESLAEMGMTVRDLAARMAVPVTLLSGNIPIDAEIAEKLSAVIGSSAQFWLNLQESYLAGSARRI